MARKPAAAVAAVDTTPDVSIIFTELRAENFKRLRAVRIRPDGSVIQITGKNDMGKTSVLDAFSAAIGGKDFCPKVPIRKGEKEAEVYVDLGSLRVTRRWWWTKPVDDDAEPRLATDVIVEYADGARAKQPQSVLNELRDADIADDPISFMRLDPKEKFDTLRKLVPGIDFDDIAKQRKDIAESRTQIGRERDRAKAASESIRVPAGTPDKLVDTADVVNQITEATSLNEKLANARWKRDAILKSIEDWRNQADTLYVQAKALEKEAENMEAAAAKAAAIPDPIDISELQATLSNAEVINSAVHLLQDQERFRLEYKEKDEQYDLATAQIEALDKQKAKAIEQAKLPVANMSFGDNELLMNGVPFEEASKANQIRACTAIAMALKPKLKVILIRDGSLLDDDSMAALAEIVTANKFVVMVERVAHGERVGIVIEDGEVALVSEHRWSIDEPLPSWAIGNANGKRMQVGAALPTRDGRVTGNATVIEVTKAYGMTLTVCRTDAGNEVRLNDAELEQLFYEPRWLKRID